MRAKILLADSAEVREGLLFLLGGGWTQTGPAPQGFAFAGIIQIEWDEANRRHSAEFTIVEEDGPPLMIPLPTGDMRPFRIDTQFEVGRPPGSPPGTSFNLPIALPILPIPWTAGHRYVAILRIDGDEHDRLTFSVRPAAPQRP
jgi:hypothetical protein